jgi:hypothetical protein
VPRCHRECGLHDSVMDSWQHVQHGCFAMCIDARTIPIMACKSIDGVLCTFE